LKGAKDIKDSAFSEDPIVEYFCSIFDVMTSTHYATSREILDPPSKFQLSHCRPSDCRCTASRLPLCPHCSCR
jgi:hypothetical protein